MFGSTRSLIWNDPRPKDTPLLGEFNAFSPDGEPGHRFGALILPIPALLTVLLPFAIGPFIAFRFRLWHYLVYTTLVAVELAYYLRWQG